MHPYIEIGSRQLPSYGLMMVLGIILSMSVGLLLCRKCYMRFADYFVICSGNSTTQIKALSDEVEYVMKNDYQIYADHVEGHNSNRWVLIDFRDVVVHVFHPEDRANYDLEKLWNAKGSN